MINRNKPTLFEWLFCLLLLPIGLFFSNLAHFNGFLSVVGFGGGIGGLIGLSLRRHSWNKLSPQEQREVERQLRDERNLSIREKAAHVTISVMYVGLMALAVFFELKGWKSGSFLCIGLVLVGALVQAAMELYFSNSM